MQNVKVQKTTEMCFLVCFYQLNRFTQNCLFFLPIFDFHPYLKKFSFQKLINALNLIGCLNGFRSSRNCVFKIHVYQKVGLKFYLKPTQILGQSDIYEEKKTNIAFT